MKKSILIPVLGCLICFFAILPVRADDHVSAQIKQYVLTAVDASAKEDYETTIQNCSKVLELDPNNVAIRIWRADGYYHQKKYEQALQDFDEALRLNPKNELAIYDKACVYSLQNKPQEALQLLRQLCYMDGRWKQSISQDKDFDPIRDTAAFQELTGIDVFINGAVLASDSAPLLAEGRALVPLRAIFEALGAKVEWDAAQKKINCVTAKGPLLLQIDNLQAKLNDQEIRLDTAAIIKQNRTYVPLRFVAESMGAGVIWEADSKQVHISTTVNAPVAPDEQKRMESLKETLDFCPILGRILHPYSLKDKQGIAIIIAKSQADLQAFQSLQQENQKALLNSMVQSRWGTFLGCESVRIYFVFNGQRYAETTTAFQKQAPALTLLQFQPGIATNVITQEEDRFYCDYYGDKKSVFDRSEADRYSGSEKMIPYQVKFNGVNYASVDYPEGWEVKENSDMVVFLSPDEGEKDAYRENINMNISQIPAEMMGKLKNPEAFIEYAKQQYAGTLKDVKFESARREQKTEYGNGYIFIYTCKINHLDIKGKSMAFLRDDGFLLYFEMAAEKENYDKSLAIYEAMSNSFKYANAAAN